MANPTSIKSNLRTTAIAIALLIASTATSAAIEAKSVMERFIAFSTDMGHTFSYQEIENDTGSSFTLKGASIAMPDLPPLMIGSVEFQGITDGADGTITIGAIVYNELRAQNEDVVVTVDRLAATDFSLPPKGQSNLVPDLYLFKTVRGSNIKLSLAGKDVLTIKSISVDNATVQDTIRTKAGITGMVVDLTGIDDSQFKNQLKALNYDGIFSGKIETESMWNKTDGRISLDKFDLALDNIGKLSISFAINGYTPELAQRLQKASQADVESGGSKMFETAIMEELPNLAIENLAVKFTDDSITRRVLTMQGKKMGGSADDMAKMVPMMLPLVMGGIGNADFATMVAGAIGRFLGDPDNIEISINPFEPVVLAEIFGIAMAAPQTLPAALAVKVTANE